MELNITARKIGRAASLIFLIAIPSISCFVVSEAKGVVSDVQIKDDMVIDSQGNPDYAVTVYCTVENVGRAGKILVTPRLHSSEGDWSEAKELEFSAGESRNLKFLFPQPTISATDINARVDVYPESSSSN